MRREKLGGLNTRISGGVDGQGGGEGPAVVLFHGFGAPGDDLVPLGEALALPRETRFLFPEAPLSMEAIGYGDSRAWWMINMARLERVMTAGDASALTDEIPEGLAEARAMVLALVDEAGARLDVSPGRLVLGGFSQGAMLALDAALHMKQAPAALALLSGTLIAQPLWSVLMPSRAGLKVFQSHGSADPLLPISLAERLREMMRSAGLEVEWTAFYGGHEIPLGVLRRLAVFLAKALGGLTPPASSL
jgi:phospholipase/carboxylesterase